MLNKSHKSCSANKNHCITVSPWIKCSMMSILYCTCARCRKELCLFRDETKRCAMGSFLAARHSGRFSRDEVSQCSQCLAKFRMSANKLMSKYDSTVISIHKLYFHSHYLQLLLLNAVQWDNRFNLSGISCMVAGMRTSVSTWQKYHGIMLFHVM